MRPIDGLDLDVPAGYLAILLGPSGCGKTTLLSCLGGILTPTSGEIAFGDEDVTALDGTAMAAYRRHTVGIVFQAFNLVPSLTALENVMVPLRAAGRSRGGRRRGPKSCSRTSAWHDRMTHRPGDLSGGQQQRVAVARALALDPPLLLADEPTAHLDFIQVEEVLRLIRELAVGRTGGRGRDARPSHAAARRPGRRARAAVRVHRTGRPRRLQLAPGAVVFAQGTMGDLIYVVSEGELESCASVADGAKSCSRVDRRRLLR